MKDGLIDNRVRRIASDSAGNVWFAASRDNSFGGEIQTGLSRYDGKSFVNFSIADGLASEVVYGLHVDPRGGVWAGTLKGVSHYDAQSMTVYDFRDGLDDGAIRSLTSTADGSVWIQVGESPGKLSRFDGQRLSKVTREDGLPGSDITNLYVDRDGALLVGDQTAPVARWAPTSVPGDGPRFEPVPESGRFPRWPVLPQASCGSGRPKESPIPNNRKQEKTSARPTLSGPAWTERCGSAPPMEASGAGQAQNSSKSGRVIARQRWSAACCRCRMVP